VTQEGVYSSENREQRGKSSNLGGGGKSTEKELRGLGVMGELQMRGEG